MRAYNTKTFVFTKEPTGGQLSELVWDNDLVDWAVEIEKMVNDLTMHSTNFQTARYRWEVRFRKDIP